MKSNMIYLPTAWLGSDVMGQCTSGVEINSVTTMQEFQSCTVTDELILPYQINFK